MTKELIERASEEKFKWRIENTPGWPFGPGSIYDVGFADGAAYQLTWDKCDVCLGEPLKSGRTCMCGGTGRMSQAALYLREQLVKSEMLLERFASLNLAGDHYEELFRLVQEARKRLE